MTETRQNYCYNKRHNIHEASTAGVQLRTVCRVKGRPEAHEEAAARRSFTSATSATVMWAPRLLSTSSRYWSHSSSCTWGGRTGQARGPGAHFRTPRCNIKVGGIRAPLKMRKCAVMGATQHTMQNRSRCCALLLYNGHRKAAPGNRPTRHLQSCIGRPGVCNQAARQTWRGGRREAPAVRVMGRVRLGWGDPRWV